MNFKGTFRVFPAILAQLTERYCSESTFEKHDCLSCYFSTFISALKENLMTTLQKKKNQLIIREAFMRNHKVLRFGFANELLNRN